MNEWCEASCSPWCTAPRRYAKAGKSDKEDWLSFTKDYFIQRDQLVHVLLLIDSSLPPQQVDVDCALWLGECQVRYGMRRPARMGRGRGATRRAHA